MRASSALWAIIVGRRFRSLMRNSRAIIIQLQTSADPPYDRKGVVRPVSGMSR